MPIRARRTGSQATPASCRPGGSDQISTYGKSLPPNDAPPEFDQLVQESPEFISAIAQLRLLPTTATDQEVTSLLEQINRSATTIADVLSSAANVKGFDAASRALVATFGPALRATLADIVARTAARYGGTASSSSSAQSGPGSGNGGVGEIGGNDDGTGELPQDESSTSEQSGGGDTGFETGGSAINEDKEGGGV